MQPAAFGEPSKTPRAVSMSCLGTSSAPVNTSHLFREWHSWHSAHRLPQPLLLRHAVRAATAMGRAALRANVFVRSHGLALSVTRRNAQKIARIVVFASLGSASVARITSVKAANTDVALEIAQAMAIVSVESANAVANTEARTV